MSERLTEIIPSSTVTVEFDGQDEVLFRAAGAVGVLPQSITMVGTERTSGYLRGRREQIDRLIRDYALACGMEIPTPEEVPEEQPAQ